MIKKNKRIISKIIKSIDQETYKIIRFCLYVSILFTMHMTSAVFYQKIYKTPYTRNNADLSNSEAPQQDYFSNPFGIPLFNGFFGFAYGFFMYQIFQHNNTYRQEQNNSYFKQMLKLSFLEVTLTVIFNIAIVLTSFTTINLINCCNLLTVVLFAVFFGKASSKYRVEKRQIFIAALITVGIIIFNVFAHKEANPVNKPLSIWTTLLIIFWLIMEGYKPQLLAQIRQQYSPPPSLIYYQVSKYCFLLLLAASILSNKLFQLAQFIWEHDRLALDLMSIAIMDTIGAIFVYRIYALHKQHVAPMIKTIRKLLTSVFNIWYFNHTIGYSQWIGFGIVVSAVTLELYLGYKQKLAKFKEIQKDQLEPQPYIV